MKKGKMLHSPLFSLYYLPGDTHAFAAVASKKVSKLAVIRNRNKRRVREAFRKQPENLTKGSFILFIKKDLATVPYSDLVKEIAVITAKAR